MPARRVVLATGNAGKLGEMRAILAGHGLAHLLVLCAVAWVDEVVIEAIGPLTDVRIEIDHLLAVPAHGRSSSG